MSSTCCTVRPKQTGVALLPHLIRAPPPLPPSSFSADEGAVALFAAQVGYLGDNYDTWTHKPLTGAPRYFDANWAEMLTKNPWWVVPTIWSPVICGGALASLYLMQWQVLAWLSYVVPGILTWKLIEYSLHRWGFHMKCKSHAAIVVHFALHGAHHKYPMDKLRLVFPPLPASLIALLIYGGLYAALGHLSTSLSTMVGVGVGYLSYDMIHYWCHHGRDLPGYLEAQKRIHMAHHYRDHSVSFGISSPLYDYVFGTVAGKAAASSKAE